MRNSARLYDLTAAGIAGGLALVELVRVIVTGGRTMADTRASGIVGVVAFSAVLGLAAVGLTFHRRVGWGAGIFGVIAAASYGIFVRASGHTVGVLYILAAPVLFGLLVKDLHAYSSEPDTDTDTDTDTDATATPAVAT
jgi:hypothetical protein